MSNVSQAKPSGFENVLEAAVAASAALAARTLTAAEDLLWQAAAAAPMPPERRRLEDAASALKGHRAPLVAAYPGALREEFAAPVAGPAGKGGAMTFETLELMAEDEMEDAVEMVRGRQAVMTVVEHELVALNALVSAAQGHDRVRAGENPLRPEVWVGALHGAFAAAKAPPAVRSLWMLHATRALGPELARLYRELCDGMRRSGVAAANYRISVPDPGQERAAPAAPARADTLVTLRDLRHLLVTVGRPGAGPAGSQPQAAPPQTLGNMTVPFAMEALQGMPRRDDVVRRMEERWREGTWQGEPVGPQEGDGAADGAYSPTQTLAREVVRLMVANMAADARLLPQVQEALRALEPALLRLVARDQRFFADRQHPARQLLDEVTRRSLAWADGSAAGFGEFLRPLMEVVHSLARMPLQDAEPFEFALQTLRHTWAESEEHTRRQRAAMARALLNADERNHLASEIAGRLRRRADVAGAPAEVRRFLLGPWCQTMAAARLAAPEGTADPGGYEAVVNDLVWISQPSLAAQNPGRLAMLGASVRQTLRHGLARIGYPQQDADRFFGYLDTAQERASQAQARPPAAGSPPVLAGHEEPGTDEAGDVPWLLPSEVSVSGAFPATLPPDFQPTEKEPPRERLPAGSVEALQLRDGQFIEIAVAGQWTRWQLTWTSPHGLLYMFTDATGKPESMTRQTMEQLLALGGVRLLPSHGVVDGALDAVARDALENSARSGT